MKIIPEKFYATAQDSDCVYGPFDTVDEAQLPGMRVFAGAELLGEGMASVGANVTLARRGPKGSKGGWTNYQYNTDLLQDATQGEVPSARVLAKQVQTSINRIQKFVNSNKFQALPVQTQASLQLSLLGMQREAHRILNVYI